MLVICRFSRTAHLVFGGQATFDGNLDAIAHADFYLLAFKFLLRYAVGEYIYKGAVSAELYCAFGQGKRFSACSSTISALAE